MPLEIVFVQKSGMHDITNFLMLKQVTGVEEEEVHVKFMRRMPGGTYRWPALDDTSKEPTSSVLFVSQEPEASLTGTRLQYKFCFAQNAQISVLQYALK